MALIIRGPGARQTEWRLADAHYHNNWRPGWGVRAPDFRRAPGPRAPRGPGAWGRRRQMARAALPAGAKSQASGWRARGPESVGGGSFVGVSNFD